MKGRTLVLLACVVGYLSFLARDTDPRDWLLVLAALALSTAGRWTPLGALLAQCVLLAAADLYAPGVLVPMKVLACVLLFELAVNRTGPHVALGAAALGLVVGFNVFDELPSALFKVAVLVGAPLLLGAYVRLARRAERDQVESRVRQARLEQRTAISRELHDLVAHHVSSMVLRLGVARHVRGEPDELLDELHATGSAAMNDLRRLVDVLRDPDQPPLPAPASLAAALEAAVAHGRRNGLDITSTVDPLVSGLDSARGFALLRLVQEGLANARKHGGPGVRVLISVTEDGAVSLDLTSSVAGPVAEARDGNGLTGMRERVALLGGRFAAGPVEHGWRVSAVLP